VRYGLKLKRKPMGVVITVSLFGGSRDAHLPGWLPWAIRRTGITVAPHGVHGEGA
jgi:hypothetical protein